jgi:hypothetical protein
LEESFLFRVKNVNRGIFIIWENINPARATYIFKTAGNDSRLRKILAYISEQEQAKRLYLKNKRNLDWTSKELGYIGCVEHVNLEDYKYQIRQIVGK